MFPQLGLLEMLIVLGLAVLLFGKRLPEVGRQLGRGIIEFRKGMSGITDDLGEGSASRISHYSSNYDTSRRYDEKLHGDSAYTDASVPKFELPGTASSPVPPRESPQPTAQD